MWNIVTSSIIIYAHIFISENFFYGLYCSGDEKKIVVLKNFQKLERKFISWWTMVHKKEYSFFSVSQGGILC